MSDPITFSFAVLKEHADKLREAVGEGGYPAHCFTDCGEFYQFDSDGADGLPVFIDIRDQLMEAKIPFDADHGYDGEDSVRHHINCRFTAEGEIETSFFRSYDGYTLEKGVDIDSLFDAHDLGQMEAFVLALKERIPRTMHWDEQRRILNGDGDKESTEAHVSYEVEVQRVAWGNTSVTVRGATSITDVEQRAIAAACDREISTHDAEYRIASMTAITDHQAEV
ncbi:MAG: hypothetical protein LAT62_15040 [Natronospirillum sp.]|uniref:hypothetical protein n=1 Tax=Natronospirillum sp. TaxID=2812955 RepID=UPI0025D0E406|nr:hypothetical protein [Natronospirillum sp.]MCH8553252.1 hypothetical protein [Natronospirillum sp.]